MPPSYLPARRNPTPLWQRLPWNALFWLAVLSVTAVSSWLTVQVETQRRRTQIVETAAVLKDGDLVDAVLVLSGDEIIVERDHGRAKVRMLGIRAFDPSVNEFDITAYGRGAVAFLENSVVGHEVKLVFGSPVKDIHGRYLAYIERDGIDVNRRLLEEGLAMVYTEYPFEREKSYLTYEGLARSAHRGIWSGKRTVARIKALRRDWKASRHQRTGKTPLDPLGETIE